MKRILLSFLILGSGQFLFSQSDQNALDFDGTNDAVQTSASAITGNTAKTIEAWIKTTANANPSAGGSQRVIVDMGTMTTGGRFTLCLLWSNAIRLEVEGSGVSGTIAVNDGNWHHVAGVYDPNATLKFLLYVDGVLDTAANNSTPVATTTGNIRIGRRVDNVNLFDGIIDEVRVWDVVRTPTEIASNRNAEFCTIPNNLVAYYTFNQGTAGGTNSGLNNLHNAVGNANGTLSGFSLTGSSSNWVSGAPITRGLSVDKQTETACDSFLSPSGNYTWTTSGSYFDTLVNAHACDSIIRVGLTINNSAYTVLNDSSCSPYPSPSGKYTYTTPGIYFDTTLTAKGCQHVYELNLNVNVVDTSVTQNAHTLMSNENKGTLYRWLDCNNDFTVISGANSQSFSPVVDGDYAVMVAIDQCVDTSACFNIYGIGVGQNELEDQLNLFPNPVGNAFQLTFEKTIENGKVEILNSLGDVALSVAIEGRKSIEINTAELPNGSYLVKVISETGVAVLQIVK